MINPEDIAELVLLLFRQPDNINLAEVVVRRFDPKRQSLSSGRHRDHAGVVWRRP